MAARTCVADWTREQKETGCVATVDDGDDDDEDGQLVMMAVARTLHLAEFYTR